MMRQFLTNKNLDLTEGSIPKGIIAFALPVFLGQLLQQLYNMVDAWVIGNFADANAFAAVSSTGTVVFLIIGFFMGISMGGSVVISRYFGAKDDENLQHSIHSTFLLGIIASVISTVLGTMLTPLLLKWLGTPEVVLPHAKAYLGIYFAGVSTVILYNICVSIMRAVGDSVHPLYYLIFSSIVNIFLDLLLVASPFFRLGVAGAAIATIISQGLSVVLCLRRLFAIKDNTGLDLRKIHFYPYLMKDILHQGLPAGVQNAVITVGNLVVQRNINSFGPFAMAGHGAYTKIEGMIFLPIMSISMTMPTFISQNLGARKYSRAKKGAAFGIAAGMASAELTGFLLYTFVDKLLTIFISDPEALKYGIIQSYTVSFFFFLLAFSHCAAGVLRGCGKSVIPMIGMLTFWCGLRITYVTFALRIIPQFRTISWAYPLTWCCTTIMFLIYLLKTDWTHAFEKKH